MDTTRHEFLVFLGCLLSVAIWLGGCDEKNECDGDAKAAATAKADDAKGLPEDATPVAMPDAATGD
tara:strand:+ start:364 stop:561 length:198 start_codon:yes stop_codon:yes gene_type:complete